MSSRRETAESRNRVVKKRNKIDAVLDIDAAVVYANYSKQEDE